MSIGRRSFVIAPIQRRELVYLVAGICLAVASLALGILFQREIVGAVDVWLTSTAYNHCFLIIPVAAYMAWDRRANAVGLRPKADWRFLPAIVVLSALWLVAVGVDILEARQFIVVAIFQFIAVAVLGWALYRAFLAPFLYLFLLVPSGGFLVPWLQDYSAKFAVLGLKIVGVPVYADGTIIEIPAGTFVVAEACAGLRFLVASLAFGIFFAVVMYKSPIRRILFVGLSLVVPIVANWCRVFGIVYLADLTGSAEAVEADHIIYGWGFFTVVTIILIIVGNTFSDRHRVQVTRRVVPQDGSSAPNWQFLAIAILGVAFAAAGPSYASFVEDHRGVGAELSQAAPPSVAAPWHLIPDIGSGWKPVVFGADKEFVRAYSDGKVRVRLFVALYRQGGVNNNLVRQNNRIADEKQWQRANDRTARAVIGGTDATIGVTEIANPTTHLVVWHFYMLDGTIVPGTLMAKLYQTRDFFIGGDRVAAFIAVATDAEGPEPRDTLARFLNATEPVPLYLQHLDRSSEAAPRH